VREAAPRATPEFCAAAAKTEKLNQRSEFSVQFFSFSASAARSIAR
jgi:hypothetical protein